MPEYSLEDIFNMVEQTALPDYPDEEKLAALSPEEATAINKRLIQIAENDDIFAVLWKGRDKIYDAVRAVKKWTKTDFHGPNAEGDDLDLNIIDASDVVQSGTQLTTFVKNVTAGTTYYWSGTNDDKVKLDDDEAIVILGWYDPIDSPKASRVLIELPKRNFIANLSFELNKDVPLIVHEPIIVKPKESFRVQVRYKESGTDMLMPIGVHIRKASDRSL